MSAEIVLKRFADNLDYQISMQTDPASVTFILAHYGKEHCKDEDLDELRGYYKGLKVAKEMLQRIIDEVEYTGVDEHQIREKAINEFAERVKRYYYTLRGNTASALVAYNIDEIAKELLEEQ